MLIIGRVSQNRAMIRPALRQEAARTGTWSTYPRKLLFRGASGTAILTPRDLPLHTPAEGLRSAHSMGTLPPLGLCMERVQAIFSIPAEITGATWLHRDTRPLVPGVDAGSTTTKAVLIDPDTRDVVAWEP